MLSAETLRAGAGGCTYLHLSPPYSCAAICFAFHMSTIAAQIADPVALVDSLEPVAIRDRLAELDRQSRALRVLLRAAVARERQTRRRLAAAASSVEGGGHAA
jgi:hypothetical protein